MSIEVEIITPLGIERVDGVLAVHAEGSEGNFTLLPRHADYVSSLAASLLSLRRPGGVEYWGVDEGALVKVNKSVRVSVRHAIRGSDLRELRERVRREFKEIDGDERKARSALASLGSGIARLMLDLREART
jgi:F-type H+-transporting ATPase subunit epsilon